MLIKICAGKEGDPRFPEIGELEVETVDEAIIKSEKIVYEKIGTERIIKGTIYHEASKTLLVFVDKMTVGFVERPFILQSQKEIAEKKQNV